MSTHPQSATMSVEQAGKLIGISRRSAYRAIAAGGDLPVIRLGRRLLVPTCKLYDMLGLPAPDITQDGDAPDGHAPADADEAGDRS